ncbi:MAG: GNAT family N-acetyltransferase, partial [Spirochaetes bacterium]|nr:GNAT family N-acetyltransferase [Spirochaetota bacterium]
MIHGKKIRLRPAEESDREKIFNWLAKSDVTRSMMGPPDFPEHPVPSWEEFCDDYSPRFFNKTGDGMGRVYIVIADDEEVGTAGYDLLDMARNRVILDIWMAAEKYCCHGYGSDAIKALCEYIYGRYGITNFIISPSARNKRAVAAYHKSGFQIVSTLSREEQDKEFGVSEYDDNLLMKKEIRRRAGP